LRAFSRGVLMRVFQPAIQSFDGQTVVGKNGIVKKIFYPPAPGNSSRQRPWFPVIYVDTRAPSP
jgi:hypothetical protein